MILCMFFLLLSTLATQEKIPSQPPNTTELSGPIEVTAEAARPVEEDLTNLVVVTVRNRSTVDITDVVMSVGSGEISSIQKTIDVLKAGQSWAERFTVTSKTSNLHLMATYKWNNQDHSIARAIPRPEISKSSMWPILLPVLSSLVGAILASWLLNFFTEKREKSRARFEWSKMLFEKYEKSYRDFLRNWGSSTSPIVLRTQFETLESTSLVPSFMQEMYRKTLSTLSNNAVTEPEKEQASSNLRQAVERFMQRPWYGEQ